MSAPGWYPDPSGTPRQRYFDGAKWTEQYAPIPPVSAPALSPKSGSGTNWLIVVGALGLAFVVALVLSLGNDDESRGTSSSNSGVRVGSGTAARDGKFEFTVSQLSSGSQYANELDPPRGRWLIADVVVRNIGNEPQSFFVGNQKLIDTDGREYAADDMAAMRINEESMVLDLGPGFSLRVLIPFDVPAGTSASALQLHDSAFSGGVRIAV